MLCRVSMTGPSVFGVAALNIELARMTTLDNSLDGIAVPGGSVSRLFPICVCVGGGGV